MHESRWPAQLIASAVNPLGQYASSPGYRAKCHTELADMDVNRLNTQIPVDVGGNQRPQCDVRVNDM